MKMIERLKPHHFEHFQKMNKVILRELALEQEEIAFLYDLDDVCGLTTGTSIRAVCIFLIMDFDKYINKLFIYLNEYTFKSNGKKGLNPLQLLSYVTKPKMEVPLLDEVVETELYYDSPELLNGFIKLRIKAKNLKLDKIVKTIVR